MPSRPCSSISPFAVPRRVPQHDPALPPFPPSFPHVLQFGNYHCCPSLPPLQSRAVSRNTTLLDAVSSMALVNQSMNRWLSVRLEVRDEEAAVQHCRTVHWVSHGWGVSSMALVRGEEAVGQRCVTSVAERREFSPCTVMSSCARLRQTALPRSWPFALHCQRDRAVHIDLAPMPLIACPFP